VDVPTVEVLSGDDVLLAALQDRPWGGQVHSVYRHAVNLSTSGGLVTFVSERGDNAPRTLVLQVPDLGALGLRPGMSVWASPGGVTVENGLQLSVAGAVRHQPRMPSLAPLLGRGASATGRAMQTLSETLAGSGVRGGVLPALHLVGSINRAVAQALADRITLLSEALARNESRAALEAACGLIGLGVGLTPAGDDYLTGLAAVCASPGSVAHTRLGVLARAVELRGAATTEVSITTLREALQGRVGESVAALGTALNHDDAGALAAAAETVIGIGSTSGTDILSGMQAGLQLERELRGWT
jgi:hypothetical protein